MDLPVMPPIEPMLARAADEIRPGWLYEPKWDGFRALVFKDGDEVVIISRNARPLGRYFPEVVSAVEILAPRCVVDGEIIITNPDTGTLDFWALQQRLHPAQSRVELLAERTPAQFVVFDILSIGDLDLTVRPFRERRQILEDMADWTGTPVRLTPITSDPAVARRWFEEYEGAGLDGVVAKDGDDAYQPGRRVMEKVKHDRTADCVVVGYRTYKGDPAAVGSLMLALYEEDTSPGNEWTEIFGGLVPIGVASSFPMAKRRSLHDELQPFVVDMAEHPWGEAIAEVAGANPGSRWNPGKDLSFVPLRPELVAEVRYNHMDGGHLRHPAQFLRWRPDRDPGSCDFSQLETAPMVAVSDILAPSNG